MELRIESLADLPSAAAALIDYAGPTRFFVFEGDMGAGKTTFIKSLCAALGVTDVVTSPTFSIVNEYLGDSGTVYHFDFYRLKSVNEAFDLGYEEYFYSGNTCLVEWPGKIVPLLPDDYVKITITGMGVRTFNFERNGAVVPVL